MTPLAWPFLSILHPGGTRNRQTLGSSQWWFEHGSAHSGGQYTLPPREVLFPSQGKIGMNNAKVVCIQRHSGGEPFHRVNL